MREDARWSGRTRGESWLERNAYYLYQWTQGGMALWEVSDFNAPELETFVGLLRSAAAPVQPS